jgi:hypothetical protein
MLTAVAHQTNPGSAREHYVELRIAFVAGIGDTSAMRRQQVLFWYGGFIAVVTCALYAGVPFASNHLRITDDRLRGFWTEAPVLVFALDEYGNVPGSLIRELEFEEGRFSVTWDPFCTYRDYWGKASTERDTGFINLAIEGGNYIPKDFVGRGSYRFGPNGELLITGMSFGTKSKAKPHATYVFHRRGR